MEEKLVRKLFDGVGGGAVKSPLHQQHRQTALANPKQIKCRST